MAEPSTITAPAPQHSGRGKQSQQQPTLLPPRQGEKTAEKPVMAQNSPPPAPTIAAPTTEQSAPALAPAASPPISWAFRGLWEVTPQPLTLNTTGICPSLDIRLRGENWKAPHSNAIRDEFAEQVRAQAMSTLMDTETYRRVVELRPQVLEAQGAVQNLEGNLKKLEAEKATLLATLPVPKNLANSLHGVNERVNALHREAGVAQRNLAVLVPLYEDARVALARQIEADAATTVQKTKERGLGEVLKLLEPMQQQITTLALAWHRQRTIAGVKDNEMSFAVAQGLMREMEVERVEMGDKSEE